MCSFFPKDIKRENEWQRTTSWKDLFLIVLVGSIEFRALSLFDSELTKFPILDEINYTPHGFYVA